MHKLVILIFTTRSPQFDARWPEFLHAAERIPGLLREATSRDIQVIYGDLRCEMIHELYFDSLSDLDRGLNSPAGRRAGELLQSITGGRMALLLADHNEDALEHIRQYQAEPPAGDPA